MIRSKRVRRRDRDAAWKWKVARLKERIAELEDEVKKLRGTDADRGPSERR